MHADSVDLSGKLQIKPGQSVAVVNPPPGLVLPGVVAGAPAAGADVEVAFVARQEDLVSAEQAVARRARTAWRGSATPKAAGSGQISTATGSSRP